MKNNMKNKIINGLHDVFAASTIILFISSLMGKTSYIIPFICFLLTIFTSNLKEDNGKS